MVALLNVVAGSGSEYADLGVGFFGELDLPNSPLAAHLFGSTYGSTFRDQTGNGYDAVVVGAPTVQSLYVSTTELNCYEITLTGDAAVAVGDGTGLTLVSVARAPAASSALCLSNFDSVSTTNVALALHSASLARAYSNPGPTLSVINADAARGNRWGMYAAVITPTTAQVFERHAGAALQSGPAGTNASRAIGGPLKFRLGGAHVSGFFTGSIDLALTAIFPSALSSGQLDAVYAYLNTFLTPKGVALS